MSILTTMFLGLCALIVVFQLVPAAILFIGMMKAMFKNPTQSSEGEKS